MVLVGVQDHMSGWLTLFILLSVGVAKGQPTVVQPSDREAKLDQPPASPLLKPDRSSVYMEFKKAGKCPTGNREQEGDRVWLTLENNTRWTISVLANGIEEECYGDTSPFYEVEANEQRVPDGPIPCGHWFDVASSVEIESGAALNFSVPKAHLDPGLSIRVDFKFDWEKNSRYTRHSSYFSYWDLPKALHDKAKEKRLKCVRGICLPEFQTQAVPQPSIIPAPPSLTVTPQNMPLRLPTSPPKNE